MSNKRQSLKDLQERLAQRLSAAKTEAVSASWLAVEVDQHRYLLPLVQSGEIFPWASLQVVPYTQAWYAGVVSLRGGLHGVIDLFRFPGLGSSAASGGVSPVDRVSSESRLVSLHAALGVNAVLWVDRLLGLRNPAMFSALGDPSADGPRFSPRTLIDHQGVAWHELDLQLLSTSPEFLAIAA